MDYLLLVLLGVPLFVMSSRFWAGLIRLAVRNAGSLVQRIRRLRVSLAEQDE